MALAELLEEVDVEYFGGELLGEDAADDAATTAANGGDSSSNGGRAEISPEPAYGPNCGACADPTGPPCAHICKRVALEPEHRVRLHNTTMCKSVVMPIEGYFFCHMGCLNVYNSIQELTYNISEVMPDEGPGNLSESRFLLPTRKRPDSPLEAPPWLNAEGSAPRAVPMAAHAASGSGDGLPSASSELHEVTRAAAVGVGAAEAAGSGVLAVIDLATVGTRVELEGASGVVIGLGGSRVAVAFDNCACSRSSRTPMHPDRADCVRPANTRTRTRTRVRTCVWRLT